MKRLMCSRLVMLACGALSACSGDHDEIQGWIDQQVREVKPSVQPIAPPRKFEPEPYSGAAAPEPFGAGKLVAGTKLDARGSSQMLGEEMKRRKQPLEAYPLDSMVMVSDGMVDIMRAAQIAPRGIAKIAIGGLESYKSNPQVAELLRHKDDLMKIVAMYSGDGNFKVKVDTDPAKLTLSVRATGKTASEVVPLGAVLPFAAIGFFLESRSVMSMPVQQVAPPAVSPRPAPTGKHP